ncbi:MAG: DNA translocase FtsK [Pirellulaceae bacterium]|nr:DNA translocase FtsK [Pirellulaceae bacterium]
MLAILIFLGVSLVTYDRADPPVSIAQLWESDVVVYPTHATFQNGCGYWGAFVSTILFALLGVGAYYLLFSMAVADYFLLVRKEISEPLVRLTGWLFSLIGFVGIAQFVFPSYSPGPLVGSGGYLGALIVTILGAYFALAGSLILLSSLSLSGLFLCTDYLLLQLGMKVAKATSRATGKSWTHGKEILKRAPKEGTPSYEEELEESDHVQLTVKKPKKTKVSTAEIVEEEVEPEYPERDTKGAVSPKVKKPKQRDERNEVIEQLNAIDEGETHDNYQLPSVELLQAGEIFSFDEQEKEILRKAKVLEETFQNFGFTVKVVEIETGPVIAQYEIELEAGLRLSKITSLADDLAIALRVPSVRIVAPIPGKNTVGIEVPNEERQIVHLRDVIEESAEKTQKMRIPVFLGQDVSGNPLTVDLATLPHLLIAGRTGTGKSVCLNAIIASILMTRSPDEVKLLMIDPKMVELSGYGTLPHLMHPVVTDMKKAEAILAWAVEKMEERYTLLARVGVRHISSFNQLDEAELFSRFKPKSEEERQQTPTHLPFIVIIADEMADLMMTAGKEVEQHIIRLAQKSRAVGIHLILATQKPTVDVITGLIKSNLPARLSFQVASRTDSRVVLDEMGADKLLGNGDMLFLWPGTSMLLRGQGTYLSDQEIDNIVESASQGEQQFVDELVNLKVEEEGESPSLENLKNKDELYEQAIEIVVREQRGSVSLLQRALGIGYGRAARLVDYMAEDGIVGNYSGSKAREVLLTMDDLKDGHPPFGQRDVVDGNDLPEKEGYEEDEGETWEGDDSGIRDKSV